MLFRSSILRPLVFTAVVLAGVAVLAASEIEISQQPVSQILPLGGMLTVSAEAAADGVLTYQWRKKNTPIGGAVGPELEISDLKAAHATAYKCVITSQLEGKAVTVTTEEALLALVDTAARTVKAGVGKKTTLTAIAAGASLSFQWFKGDEEIPGATGKTLVLTSVQTADSGAYSCLVTAPGGSLATGIFTLIVYDEAPLMDLAEGEALPPAIISGSYEYPVPVDPLPTKAPVTFSASGLPPGLKIDKAEGVITGKPTASKSVPYDVTLTAANVFGKHTVKVKLSVAPLHENLVGAYVAVLSRFADLNGDLGGRLDLITTSRGTFSGKLVLGASTHPLTGALDAEIDNALTATATVSVKRVGNIPLALTFTLDAESNWISIAEVSDGGAILQFSGWRNIWNKTTQASGLAGYYTFGLALPESAVGEENIPQGAGYGSLTLSSATGRLTVTGKLPDGTAYTMATFAGPGGEIALFQTLYPAASRGSLLGTLFIGLAESTTDNTVYGSLSWWYPGSEAKNARLYAEGFGPLDLTLEGAVYTPPVAPKVALGLTEGLGAHGTLTFDGPFSDIPAPSPGLDFSIGARSKLSLPAVADNPRKTTLSLVAAKGTFSGKFTLKDPDLLTPGKVVTRAGSYSGIIVREPTSGTEAGKGFFVLPQRPAVEGETAASAKILSGQVVLSGSSD